MISTKLLNFVKPAIKRSVISGRCTSVYGSAYKPSTLSYAFQSHRYLTTSSSFNNGNPKVREMGKKEEAEQPKKSEMKSEAEFKFKLETLKNDTKFCKFGFIAEAVRMIF